MTELAVSGWLNATRTVSFAASVNGLYTSSAFVAAGAAARAVAVRNAHGAPGFAATICSGTSELAIAGVENISGPVAASGLPATSATSASVSLYCAE